jgi:beta-lactamase class A
MNKYSWPLVCLIVGILLGVFINKQISLGASSSSYANSGTTGSTDVREGETSSSLINPLLECNYGQDYIAANSIFPFKSKIQAVIDSETAKGDMSYAGFYFADLNAGSWFGINSSDDFRPASLLKVPLMMSFLKKEDDKPGTLNQVVTYDGSNLDASQNIPPEEQVVSGQKYTIWQLLQYSIEYSDNKATSQLFELADNNDLNNLYQTLGIDLPANNNPLANFISLRQYASFFQILFNSSYFDSDLSEKALNLLINVDFKNGIVGGVPSGIKVAHKFGETTDAQTGADELYDCGIVYYPEKPYLICITTKGSTFSGLEKAIQAISTATYNEVDKQVKNLGV